MALPKSYVIWITGADPVSGLLTLSDRGETDVQFDAVGDLIYWAVKEEVGELQDITAITKKDDGSSKIMNPVRYTSPYPGSKVTWFANVQAPVGSYEDYSITWTDSTGNSHIHDPKIKVNS